MAPRDLSASSSTGGAAVAPAAPPVAASKVTQAGEARGDIAICGPKAVDNLDRLAPCRKAGADGDRDDCGSHGRDQQQCDPEQACRLRASTASRLIQTS